MLLEALNVMSAYAENRNLTKIFPGLGAQHENESYGMHPRKDLRHLLFRDRNL